MYWHKAWQLVTLVHGDDFVTVGTRENSLKFRRVLEGRFEMKTQVFGGAGTPSGKDRDCHRPSVSELDSVSEIAEGRVLNRIVRWTEEGWELEPDQRHAGAIQKGGAGGGAGAKGSKIHENHCKCAEVRGR